MVVKNTPEMPLDLLVRDDRVRCHASHGQLSKINRNNAFKVVIILA